MAVAPRSAAALTHRDSVPHSMTRRVGLPLAAMYVLTLVGFPLVSTVPVLVGLDSQAATIPYRAAMVGLSFAILYGWWLQRSRVCLSLPVILALLLWVLLVGRLLLDTVVDPLPGDIGLPVSQFLLLSLGACFLPSLAFLEAPSVATADFARRCIEVLGAVAMLLVLYLGLRGVFAGGVLRRLSTPVLNPISVGHLGVSVLIVAMCGLASASRVARLLRWLLMALSVVATVSRGPIAAGLVIVLLLAMRPRAGQRIGLGGILLRFGLIGAGVAAVVLAINHLEELEIIDVVARLTDTLQDVASQERAAMIVGAWQQFTVSPLLGDALVERRFMENPHNIIVESLMALGVVGLGLLLLSMAASLAAGFGIYRGATRHAWVALIYLQYVIHCLLSGSLLTDGAFWFFGLAVLALARTPPARSGA